MPTILEHYKRDAVLENASDISTPEASSTCMDTFRDELATSLALGWH
jgi:hypothetical protein